MRRRDHGLAEPGDRSRQDGAAARIELREHVVEQQQRGRGQRARPRRAGARAVRAAARPAIRTRAARGRRPRSRGRRGAGRGRSSRARGRHRSAPPAQRRSVLRRRTPSRPSGSPSSARRSRKAGDSAAAVSRRASTSDAPSSATRSVQGETTSRGARPSWTRRRPAFRCASADAYSCGKPACMGSKPPEHPVDVCTANRRPTLDDSQAVGREHERRELAPERLGRGKPRAVELRRLAALRSELHPDLVTHAAAIDLQRHGRSSLAETDQAPIRARSRREPLRRRDASPRAGSSCRPRCPRSRGRCPARERGRDARTSGSYEA